MLEVYEYNGENDGGASGEGGQGLALITSVDGVIEVSRNGGNAELIPALGEFSVQAPLGKGIEIEPGGYLLAEPGAGWSITGGTGAPSTGLVLMVSSILGPDATPVPTAAPGTIGTVSLFGEARSCDIVPLTNSDIATALATPASSESPLDRSMRDADGDPADQLTFDAVVYRLQEYADCVAAGDYARTYAFDSDQAIRESDVIQDLVRSGHRVEAGPSARLSLENLQVFPDGRTGARAVIDGEAAYLTFVYEDGAWKIDVWDDSVGGRVPIVTPAS